MGVKYRNPLLDTDVDKATISVSFTDCVCVCVWQKLRQTSAVPRHCHTRLTDVKPNSWYQGCLCDYYCHMITGSTGKAWCMRVYVRDRGREWRQRKGRKRCKVADCNFNWLRDECAKVSLYAFVFSAHMHLNLALHPSVSPALKWKPLGCP